MQFLRACTAAMVAALTIAAASSHAAYTVQRVVGGLNQPMFVTQAPGDNSSLYIVERNDGGNQLGRVRRYDLQSQTFTTFVDLTGAITSDGGVLSMAFHPDYQTNGLFYVTSNVNGSNRLDEYQHAGGISQFQRRLVQYNNLENVFHTINQPFFRPGGASHELFLTTGDGGTQANEPEFNPALIESPDSIYGKLLRLDLNASFPAPATDATHAGVDVVALGIRNPYRASFDRQTGDFYFGDVGFNLAEEVNFIPASHFANPSAPILDFGWTAREGTVAAGSPHGEAKAPGDIDPIFDYAHNGQPLPHTSVINGLSVTGGYVYRGPVPEFQGRYFFSDFLNGNVYSGAFNTATNPASFDGTNLTDIVDHDPEFESLVSGGADIRNVTSFGEDNAGNLYIVKFGNGFFPPLGQGELFRITPVGVSVVVDRDTGAITLRNDSGAAVSFTSLSINSSFGAIDAADLTPITGNYDSAGSGAIDNNNPWTITSPPGSHTTFSEQTTGDAGSIANGQQISLSMAGAWIPSPNEDLSITLMNGASIIAAGVAYTGNGGQPFQRSDLDFDGAVDADDWAVFTTHSYTSLAGLSGAQSYGRGDLDGDQDNDFADFRLFKADFNAANGLGAFEALTGIVPEPSAATLAFAALATATIFKRKMKAPGSAGGQPASVTSILLPSPGRAGGFHNTSSHRST
ncbi:MAG TPA: PQQ-dependent sugar dehydrogenase [Lacipirellula sp.]